MYINNGAEQAVQLNGKCLPIMCKGLSSNPCQHCQTMKAKPNQTKHRPNVQYIIVVLCVHMHCLKLSINSNCRIEVGNVNSISIMES